MLRKMNQLTQESIANALQIERSTYSSWESGRSCPKPAQLAELATLYRCSVDFIIRNNDDYDAFSVASVPNYRVSNVYGDSFLSELDDDERELIMKVRMLNSKDKAAVDEFIDNIRKKDLG